MEHFIHELEISNFKSIRHQKIEGCRRVNVFIGYPNVGKSNVLEAMSLLSYSEFDAPQLSSLVRAGESSELFFDKNISIACTVTANGTDRVRVGFLKNSEVDLEKFHSDDEGLNWSKPFSVVLNIEETFEIAQHPTGKKVSVAYNHFPPDVKKYQFAPGIPVSAQGSQPLYFPRGENLVFVLDTHPELRKEVAELFKPFDLKLIFERGEQYGVKVLKWLSDEVFVSFPFNQIADTLQRLIFHKAAIASNQNTVLLFEEPEAHMFPPYISKFTADVMYNDRGNQFFINTHSPFVINDFMEQLAPEELAIYVVGYKKETGETVIRKLTDEELHEIRQYGIDLYYNLERYLEHEEQQ